MKNNRATLHKFKRDLANASEELELSRREIAVLIAARLYELITEYNPVLTGWSQNSWITTEGAVSNLVPPPPKPGDESFLKVIRKFPVEEITGDEVIFISSGIHYIFKLEFGWSQKAPKGMVRISVAQVQTELDGLVARVRNSRK